jgi:hypothetical protein
VTTHLTTPELLLAAESLDAGQPLAETVQRALVDELLELRPKHDRLHLENARLAQDIVEISGIAARAQKRSA